MSETLIEQLEKATGPDRELDAEIFRSIGAPLPDDFMGVDIKLVWSESDGCYLMPVGRLRVRYEHPHYTASIDSALTLVPEGWAYTFTILMEPAVRNPATAALAWGNTATVWPPHKASPVSSAPTTALAICIASLRAREAA